MTFFTTPRLRRRKLQRAACHVCVEVAPVLETNNHGAGGRVSDQYARKIASSRGLSITNRSFLPFACRT